MTQGSPCPLQGRLRVLWEGNPGPSEGVGGRPSLGFVLRWSTSPTEFETHESQHRQVPGRIAGLPRLTVRATLGRAGDNHVRVSPNYCPGSPSSPACTGGPHAAPKWDHRRRQFPQLTLTAILGGGGFQCPCFRLCSFLAKSKQLYSVGQTRGLGACVGPSPAPGAGYMGTDETCSLRSGCFLPLGGGFTWEPFFPILKCYVSVWWQQCFPFYFIICLRLCWVFIAAWGQLD